MSRILMLIPLDEDVELTTISLGLIYLFDKKKIIQKTCKSILYFSCDNDLEDDTALIINQYFSKFIDVLNNIDFSKKIFNSLEYLFLINKVIEECYHKKDLYELILIKGIDKNKNIYADKINYDISQNLSAEVIFISTLETDSIPCASNKEKEVKIFLEYKKYKKILGVIFNNINSPFIRKKYNFLKKLTILKKTTMVKKNILIKKEFFNKTFFSTIACIPWNKSFIKVNIIDIYNFLGIRLINSQNIITYAIEKIIIFDDNHLNNFSYKNYSNTLIIVPLRNLDIFIKAVSIKIHQYKISGIILTEILKSKKYIMSLSQLLIKKYIPLSFTQKNTFEMIYKLQNFNFNFNFKDKGYVKKLQKYISSFFDVSLIFFLKTKYRHQIMYSPKEFCYTLKMLSKESDKRIILPESYEDRILEAAAICYDANIAKCVLLGNPKKIHSIAVDKGIKLNKNIEILDPDFIRGQYISRIIELRKNKGIDEFSAIKQLENNTVLATLILESNKVDGLVSGSVHTTADTIRPALQLIKTNPGNLLVSSIFFMLFPRQVLIYGDCAINIDPTAEELAEIAIQSANSAQTFKIVPRIAMLSYSTDNSGTGSQVEKVRNATLIVKKKRPDLIIDGPIQYDAAVSKKVSQLKNPYSSVLGAATIFIFPDLNSGNITYKAVQRSANLISIGPMLQGLRKPVNDLSRGASVEDIIYTIALTSIQSKKI